MTQCRVVLGALLACACVPVEGVPGGTKGDSGFTLVLDTGVWGGENPCSPVIPSDVTIVRASSVLSAPGQYLVCPRVPVQGAADDVVLYLSAYSYAALTGRGALVFAQEGAQVTIGGEGSTVIFEPGAIVNIAASDVQTYQCDALSWSMPLSEVDCP